MIASRKLDLFTQKIYRFDAISKFALCIFLGNSAYIADTQQNIFVLLMSLLFWGFAALVIVEYILISKSKTTLFKAKLLHLRYTNTGNTSTVYATLEHNKQPNEYKIFDALADKFTINLTYTFLLDRAQTIIGIDKDLLHPKLSEVYIFSSQRILQAIFICGAIGTSIYLIYNILRRIAP